MKFAVVGCRHPHISVFIDEMLALGHRFLGICEREGPLASRLAVRYGVPLFQDDEAVFALSPDVVGTSDVNCRKIGVIERCAARGVHVMADKPIAVSEADCDRLERAMKSVRVGMLLTERFNPALYTLRERLREGRLGRIVSVSATKPHKLTPSAREAWHFDAAQNGGIVVDLMVHDLDLVRWLTGSEVRSADCMLQKGGVPGHPAFYDDAWALLRLEDGAVASLHADWWTPEKYHTFGDGRLYVTGTAGTAEVFATGRGPNAPEPALFMNLDGVPREEPLVTPPGCITQDFLSGIQDAQAPTISHRDILTATRAALQVFAAGNRS
jgi:predicted dehydrogenase